MVKLGKALVIISICIIVVFWIYDTHFPHISETQSPTLRVSERGIYNAETPLNQGAKPNPNDTISLPNDHMEHPEFDIEWWYLTANLRDPEGNDYGLQWTLFRFTSPPAQSDYSSSPWHNNQVYMAHASLHSMQNHWFGEKFARGGVGNAGVNAMPFSLFIDNWQWQNTLAKPDLLPALLNFDMPLETTDTFLSSEPAPAVAVTLSLEQSGPYVFHGDNGYSIKSANRQHASHYYSAPFIQASGTLMFNDKSKPTGKYEVDISGNAWFDQEWTSQLLDTQTAGWDWMSLHLSDGTKIMAFRMRLVGQGDYITGSLISSNGHLRTLLPEDISLTPLEYKTVNTKELPLTWQVTIESANINIEVSTLKTDQWNTALVSYYEGMVSIKGSHEGQGFLELTGY